jgi:hypothetical protein
MNIRNKFVWLATWRVYGVHTGNQSRSQSMPVRGLCSGTREQAYSGKIKCL